MKLQFKFTEKETESPNKWMSFYPKIDRARITLDTNGYFDPRPSLSISVSFIIAMIGLFFTGFSLYSLLWLPSLVISWGTLYINLPFNTGKNN